MPIVLLVPVAGVGDCVNGFRAAFAKVAPSYIRVWGFVNEIFVGVRMAMGLT
jgi:hypothetical protein